MCQPVNDIYASNIFPGLPIDDNVKYDVVDTLTSFTLTLNGGAINEGGNSGPQDVDTANWHISMTINLYAASDPIPGGGARGVDSFTITGTAFHASEPHPVIDGGPGTAVSFSASGSFNELQKLSYVAGFNGGGLSIEVSHGDHFDDYSFPGGEVVGGYDYSTHHLEITGWSLAISGAHVTVAIPEPSCAALIGSASTMLAFSYWIKKNLGQIRGT